MSDLHNWKISVDQCHQKHIGPPPPLQRRIAFLEAHSAAPHPNVLNAETRRGRGLKSFLFPSLRLCLAALKTSVLNGRCGEAEG
jgi:hypothetical protein